MNKQMLELLVQSGLLINVSEYRVNELDPNIKKFAELIVRECISMADKESERYSNLDQEYCSMAMDNYMELVRQHFGVEE